MVQYSLGESSWYGDGQLYLQKEFQNLLASILVIEKLFDKDRLDSVNKRAMGLRRTYVASYGHLII